MNDQSHPVSTSGVECQSSIVPIKARHIDGSPVNFDGSQGHTWVRDHGLQFPEQSREKCIFQLMLWVVNFK